jgi:hypothetical protein
MNTSPRGFIALFLFLLWTSAYGEPLCPKGARSIQETTDSGEVAEWCEKDGRRDGPYRLYISGKVSREGRYEKGTLSGEWRRYHTNGNLKDTGLWRENKPHGLWQFFGEDGSLIRETLYENGVEQRPAEKDDFARKWAFLRGRLEGASIRQKFGGSVRSFFAGWSPAYAFHRSFEWTLPLSFSALKSRDPAKSWIILIDASSGLRYRDPWSGQYSIEPSIGFQSWLGSAGALNPGLRVGREFKRNGWRVQVGVNRLLFRVNPATVLSLGMELDLGSVLDRF